MCRMQPVETWLIMSDTLIQAKVQIVGLSAAPGAHSEMFDNGPDSVRVKTTAKKDTELR